MKLRSSASTNTNDNEFVNIVISFCYQTRNSAVADKPRDAFVQMQCRGCWWPPKHPLLMYYHAKFGGSGYNRVLRIITGEPAKLGSAMATPPWDERHGWLPKNKPLPIRACYHAQFGCSSLQSIVIDGKNNQNWGVLGLLSFETGLWLTP